MATYTIRPNDAGDETDLLIGGGTPAPTNWESVDEASPNDDTDYVYKTGNYYYRDLYNLSYTKPEDAGKIIHILVKWRARKETSNNAAYHKAIIKSNSTITEGDEHSMLDTWSDYAMDWTTNPATGLAWTWDEIETLQAGITIRPAYTEEGRCTQLYVEIDYVIAASVTTQAVTEISDTTATGNGNITNLGYPLATQHGHCWNTTGTPTTSDSKTENGVPGATGAFTSALTGLTAGTKYYVRAYVINDAVARYGNQVEFWADRGTVFPDPETDFLVRVSGIKRSFWAGLGGQSVYQVELALGGMSTTYVSPIGSREPTGAVTPSPKPSGQGYQQADYQKWLLWASWETMVKIFGHWPTYGEWVTWMQGTYFPRYF